MGGKKANGFEAATNWSSYLVLLSRSKEEEEDHKSFLIPFHSIKFTVKIFSYICYSARPVYLQERALQYKSTSTLPPPKPMKAQDVENEQQQPPERPPKKAHLKGDSPPTVPVTPVTPPRGQTPTSRGTTPKPKFPSPPASPLLMQKRPLPPTPKAHLKELPPPPKDFEDEQDHGQEVQKGSNAETLR